MKSYSAPTKTNLDPEVWIDEHGDYLFRYAMFRLRNREAAEDAVQETLLAAIQSHHTYEQRSSERTWLVAILRHKIVDHLRRNIRFTDVDFDTETNFESLCFESEGKYSGHWRTGFAPTLSALSCDQLVEQKDFLITLDRCLSALPERMATVFVLKEIDGLSCDEICCSLNLTKSNLWVLLHRARLQLRHSLEIEWLRVKPASSDHIAHAMSSQPAASVAVPNLR